MMIYIIIVQVLTIILHIFLSEFSI